MANAQLSKLACGGTKGGKEGQTNSRQILLRDAETQLRLLLISFSCIFFYYALLSSDSAQEVAQAQAQARHRRKEEEGRRKRLDNANTNCCSARCKFCVELQKTASKPTKKTGRSGLWATVYLRFFFSCNKVLSL